MSGKRNGVGPLPFLFQRLLSPGSSHSPSSTGSCLRRAARELPGEGRPGDARSGTWLTSTSLLFSSVQLLIHVRLFATPWTAARQASLSTTNSRSLLKLMSFKSMMPSSHLILCRPLFLLPSIFPSIRVFSSESVLHIRWPEYWSFSSSISPLSEYSALISFRMDWLDLLAVRGTLRVFYNTTVQKHQFYDAQLSL